LRSLKRKQALKRKTNGYKRVYETKNRPLEVIAP